LSDKKHRNSLVFWSYDLVHSYVSVLHAGAVKVVTDEDPGRVDTVGIGRSRAGEVDLRKASCIIEKAAACAEGVSKAAHHEPINVHAEGHRTDGTRGIKLGEDAALADEGMR
jgi:hypothetical protein